MISMEEVKTAGAVPAQRVPRKKKRGRRLLLLLLILMLAAAAVLVWRQMGRNPYDDRLEANAVVGSVPGKTQEQLQAELNEKVAEKMISFTINANPVYPDGKSAGNILFENPANNDKYTRLELVRDDTEEIIYQTGLMEPGTYVPEAPLDVDLGPGEYVCTAYIHAYKLADESYVGKVAAGVTVYVEG